MLLLLALLPAGIALLNNNLSLGSVSRAEIVGRLDKAIIPSRDWIAAVGGGASPWIPENPRSVTGNPALMHMVADCARLSGDSRLQALVALYFTANSSPYAFARMVGPNSRFEPPAEKQTWKDEDYQLWLMHAASPAGIPLSPAARANMFAPDKYRSGSATHQLFALYLYRALNGTTPSLDRLIHHISLRVAHEASVDFRVTDLYLQRVAFLLAAGQPDLVKRRWVERALDAQQLDGGWRWSWYGWQPTLYRFTLNEEDSAAHPTAQGMWIAYMLKYRYPDWIEKNYP